MTILKFLYNYSTLQPFETWQFMLNYQVKIFFELSDYDFFLIF